MEHFVSIITDKNQDLNEDLVNSIVDSTGQELVEDENEYDFFETEDEQVLRVGLGRQLTKEESDNFAKTLAEKLFDMGYKQFDIEVSMDEDSEI